MSISVNKNPQVKISLIYLAISAGLFLFNFLYGLFAHGISSAYMQYAFLFPLIGGSFVSIILIFAPKANEVVKNLWRMGITTLVVGSLLHGVFDIYGSVVGLVNVFFITGSTLLLSSLVIYIIKIFNEKNKEI